MENPSHHMGSLNVLSPGFLTTVQDLGRDHYAHLGLSPSGAADAVSLRLGNLLVGNPPNAAALEMTLVGATIVFNSDCAIALVGSDFGATLDGCAVPRWQTVFVQSRQTLRCGSAASGARCYLCVGGGILAEIIMSSSSTHLQIALGGNRGGPLRSGDTFEFSGSGPHRALTVKPSVLEDLFTAGPLRVTGGPQVHLFSAMEQSLFSSSIYIVEEESNRMGLRLSGPPLIETIREEMLTEGISVGAIQVPPSGKPIILFVEHPTTGGYPKIANVISADMHRVGQLQPRNDVRFEFVTVNAAISLLHERETILKSENCLQPI
ncbi:MAG: biotin-dependent carboxyltransferase family protein [Ignavibacteriales bacterium]|nr:biotin-dependent carboxyltransferase family protein [Ignavibacteriales bacterium]